MAYSIFSVTAYVGKSAAGVNERREPQPEQHAGEQVCVQA